MKYDDAESRFMKCATGLAREAAGTHIGFYLAWMVLNGHADDSLRPYVSALRMRAKTGTKLLFEISDGKLLAENLDDNGNFFSTAYYAPHYEQDYLKVFAADIRDTGNPADDFCAVADTWENYDRIAAVLDKRYAQWKAGQPFGPMVMPSARAMTSSLSLEPLDAAAADTGTATAASAAPAQPGLDGAGPAVDAPGRLQVTPPPADEILERMRAAIERFLGFEAFVTDTAAPPGPRPGRTGSRFVAEFPGGWHWLELLAIDERASGVQPGWGIGVTLRSRLQKLAQELAAIEQAGAVDPVLADTAAIGMEAWWEDPAALARTGDGTAYLPLNHPDDLEPALEAFGRQVDKRLKPLLRRCENLSGLDKLGNTEPLTAAPGHAPERLLQHAVVAAKAGNPRLAEICSEVEALVRAQPASPRRDAQLAHLDVLRGGSPF
jgi:hypothetical protein